MPSKKGTAKTELRKDMIAAAAAKLTQIVESDAAEIERSYDEALADFMEENPKKSVLKFCHKIPLAIFISPADDGGRVVFAGIRCSTLDFKDQTDKEIVTLHPELAENIGANKNSGAKPPKK